MVWSQESVKLGEPPKIPGLNKMISVAGLKISTKWGDIYGVGGIKMVFV